MGTAERRYEIMKILCRRRYETIRNLASEFGVSMRTVQRDIEALSRTEPIYTQFGKYGGGVYVVEGYSMDRMYMKKQELDVLQKLYIAADGQSSLLTDDEKSLLRSLISQYSKPNNESQITDRYIDLNLMPVLTDKQGRLQRGEGFILKAKKKSSGFSVVATGDNYFAPQILEVNYQL